MPTYVALVDVNESEFQNAQEFASIWGSVREDIDRLGGELRDAYALLGAYDFLVVFDAEDRTGAVKIAISIERYGLDTETMGAIPVDRLGELVEDL